MFVRALRQSDIVVKKSTGFISCYLYIFWIKSNTDKHSVRGQKGKNAHEYFIKSVHFLWSLSLCVCVNFYLYFWLFIVSFFRKPNRKISLSLVFHSTSNCYISYDQSKRFKQIFIYLLCKNISKLFPTFMRKTTERDTVEPMSWQKLLRKSICQSFYTPKNEMKSLFGWGATTQTASTYTSHTFMTSTRVCVLLNRVLFPFFLCVYTTRLC